MNKIKLSKELVLFLVFFLITSSISAFAFPYNNSLNNKNNSITNYQASNSNIKNIKIDLDFSTPDVLDDGENVVVHIAESDVSRIDLGKPVLPVNLTVFELPFGSQIVEVNYIHSSPWIFNLTGKMVFVA